jgi:2-hydroxymethylglutarate dehydrogenase
MQRKKPDGEPKMNDRRKIGFIGLGNMGRRMSLNLLKAGFKLTVYDVRPEAVLDLVQHGAAAAKNPAKVAQNSDVIITSLPTPEALKEVILGTSGIVTASKRALIVIVTDTVSPESIRKLASAVEMQGIEVLDAPVSGGTSGAENATLTIMVGGKKETFENCIDILRTIGKEIIYVGSAGCGNVVKLVNNLLSLSSVAALCEGIVLGVKAGVDAQTLRNVIMTSTGRSYALEHKLPNVIAKGKFEGGFAVDLALKDLNFAVNLGKSYQMPMTIAEVTRRIYEEAKSKGLGRKDHTAIITLLEELTGVRIRY